MNPGKARSLVFFILLFAVAALALEASYAQGRGSGGAEQKQQVPQGHHAQGQMHEETHGKSHASHQQMHVREHMPDDAIYGHEMMTAEERDRYRQRLNDAQDDREWSQMRAEHQREMQARAKAQGRQLDPPIFGEHMMTVEERNRYAERMHAAATEEQRGRIREEHQQMMLERAHELGIGEMLAEH